MLVSPGWTTYAPQVKLSGKSPIAIIQTSAATDWKLTATMLDLTMENIKSSNNKLLISNNPGNPCKQNINRFNLGLLHIYNKIKWFQHKPCLRHIFDIFQQEQHIPVTNFVH